MNLAVIALAALLTGCAPAVIWTGHTQDRVHTIEIAQRDDLQWIVVDGQRRDAYRSIAAWSIASHGDRVAYAAVRGDGWVVVGAGPTTGVWRGIGEVLLGPRRAAYSGERAGGWHVVVDGVVGPRWDAILAGTLRFAGPRVLYVARDAAGARVVVDDVAGPAWDGVGQLVASTDGAHVVYAARRGKDAIVVAGGATGAAYRAISKLHLAGATPVYAALDGDGAWRVVTGATASAPYAAVRSIVVRDQHVAYLARDRDGDLVVCDGALAGRAARIDDDSLVLGRGCDVAYLTVAEDGVRLVHGAAEARHDEISPLAQSADGARLGYAARDGDRWQVVVDGAAHDGGDWASAPVFSADGRRFGFVSRRGAQLAAVVDGVAHAYDLVMDDSLAFSRDGAHWAVVAGDMRRERLYFVVDGDQEVPLALRELYSAAAQLSLRPDIGGSGELLRAWSAAEAEKAARK